MLETGRSAISSVAAIVVVLIIVIAAGTAVYYYSTANTTNSSSSRSNARIQVTQESLKVLEPSGGSGTGYLTFQVQNNGTVPLIRLDAKFDSANITSCFSFTPLASGQSEALKSNHDPLSQYFCFPLETITVGSSHNVTLTLSGLSGSASTWFAVVAS